MSPTCQLQLLPSQTRSLALSQTYCSQSFAHSDNALAHQPPPVKALAGPLCWKHRQMAILLRVTLTARPRLVACCWPELAANKRGRVTSDDRSGASHDRPAALPDGNARKLLGGFRAYDLESDRRGRWVSTPDRATEMFDRAWNFAT
jgi:hypothetical protein